MAYRFSSDDVGYLTSESGTAGLAAAGGLALTGRSEIADLQRLRRIAGDHAAAVAETIRLRRIATGRWADDSAGTWLFDDVALQQASPPIVAAYRAGRIAAYLAGRTDDVVHDVTCSIGTDLAALERAGLTAIGSDIDPIRLAMARHNLAAAGLPARLARADARTRTSRATLRFADPARRDITGRRISSADTIPPVADLDAADPDRPAVLRLPPGIDYQRLARPGEIEIVSLAGTVREAVSWPPALATAARRATVLAVGPGGAPRVVEQLTDADADDAAVTAARRYLIDPDPAVVRAHLVRHYAARHALTRLDAHLAYLTGDTIPPGVRGFEITDTAGYSEKTIRAWCRRDGVGTLEIKQRGTPVIPDRLRRALRLTGDTRIARTLVIARIGAATRAYFCRAVPAAKSCTVPAVQPRAVPAVKSGTVPAAGPGPIGTVQAPIDPGAVGA